MESHKAEILKGGEKVYYRVKNKKRNKGKREIYLFTALSTEAPGQRLFENMR